MQGQSGYTRFKLERFGPVFAQSLLISKAASVSHYAYYHVDLNAGGGINAEVGGVAVPGSPLNFLDAAVRHERTHFFAFFVDKDPSCICELIGRPQVTNFADRVFLFESDNAELLPVVAKFVAQRERRPHFAMGSIVVDPNGYHGGVPWDALRAFCLAHPRFDLFLNLNLRTFRLERPHIVNRQGKWATKRLHPISEFRNWFGRPNWMWTWPLQIAGSSWIQCVGRTIETQTTGYARLGFHDARSPEGRAITEAVERDEATRTILELPFLWEL
jgi:hypothetical protein